MNVQPAKIERVERLRVSDAVAAQLEQLILRGDYSVGDKLPPERDLADQFGVSRSSMREAIRGVESSGLLSSSHGVGVFVVSNVKHTPGAADILVFDDFTVPELFEVRRTLESEAASLAANRHTSAVIAQMQGILEQSANADLTDTEFIALDVLLHQTITKAAGNGLLSRLHDSLEPLLVEYSHRVIALPGRRELAHAGHVKIVDAIIARQAGEARKAALDHIGDVESDLAKKLASTPI